MIQSGNQAQRDRESILGELTWRWFVRRWRTGFRRSVPGARATNARRRRFEARQFGIGDDRRRSGHVARGVGVWNGGGGGGIVGHVRAGGRNGIGTVTHDVCVCSLVESI